jgi:hypothetical protein
MKRSTSYREHLLKRLRDSKEAAAYLNAASKDEDSRVYLIALKDIADAILRGFAGAWFRGRREIG